MTAISVEIVAARGSVPREVGACMLVFADRVEGSIGGGALEYAAIARARQLMARALEGVARHRESHALGPELGQCCGGSVTLEYSPWSGAALPSPPLFHLQLHGGGHVGRALVATLVSLPCTIDWIDSRPDGFPPVIRCGPATIRIGRMDAPEEAVAQAPADTRFLVMTHSHALDFAICSAILRRPDAGFIGLIGSRTKRARFISRWRAAGIGEAAIDRLTCPIGVPGVVDKRPEVIAIAVAAQLLLPLTPNQVIEVRPALVIGACRPACVKHTTVA